MTDRATLRSSLRTRLADPEVGGLWTDAELNEAIATAIIRYSTLVPVRTTDTLAIVAGTAAYDLPADCSILLDVLDEDGYQLTNASPAHERHRSAWASATTWQQTGTTVTFTPEPAAAATYTLRYMAARIPIGDDVSDQPIAEGDSVIVLALAEAAAWNLRAAYDTKRGHSSSNSSASARRAEAEAQALVRERSRIARGSAMV